MSMVLTEYGKRSLKVEDHSHFQLKVLQVAKLLDLVFSL